MRIEQEIITDRNRLNVETTTKFYGFLENKSKRKSTETNCQTKGKNKSYSEKLKKKLEKDK